MTTWRERNQAARKRLWWGPRRGYTAEDRQRAVSWTTCLVGETAAQYGLKPAQALSKISLCMLGIRGLQAVQNDDADAVDAILDAIEDQCLELKREVVGQ